MLRETKAINRGTTIRTIMATGKPPYKDRIKVVEGETFYNDDPPNVKLEKSLVLAFLRANRECLEWTASSSSAPDNTI